MSRDKLTWDVCIRLTTRPKWFWLFFVMKEEETKDYLEGSLYDISLWIVWVCYWIVHLFLPYSIFGHIKSLYMTLIKDTNMVNVCSRGSLLLNLYGMGLTFISATFMMSLYNLIPGVTFIMAISFGYSHFSL